MLAFANMMDFLANELPSLRRWRFARALRFARAFYRGFFRHGNPP
jgi:hypothetical protein